MQFTNESHKARHYALLDVVRPGLHNKGCIAAVYILAVVQKSAIADYISEAGINFDGLIATSKRWNKAQQALVRLAATLYNPQRWPITIDDAFSTLDKSSIKVALEAIAIYYQQ